MNRAGMRIILFLSVASLVSACGIKSKQAAMTEVSHTAEPRPTKTAPVPVATASIESVTVPNEEDGEKESESEDPSIILSTPPSPDLILEDAFDAMRSLVSFRFDVEGDIKLRGPDSVVDISTVHDGIIYPEGFDLLNLNWRSQNIEYQSKINTLGNTSYIRLPGSREIIADEAWISSARSHAFGLTEDGVLRSHSEVTLVGEVTLDEAPVYHLRVRSESTVGPAYLEYWIGIEDGLIKRVNERGISDYKREYSTLVAEEDVVDVVYEITSYFNDFVESEIESVGRIPPNTSHDGAIIAIAISPDGRYLASGGKDGMIRLWDLDDMSSKPVMLVGHDDWVLDVIFSPTEDILASAGFDNTIRIWDTSNLDEGDNPPSLLARLSTGENSATSLSYTPDGQSLASVDGSREVKIWNMGQLDEEPKKIVDSIRFFERVIYSPDGEFLFAASGGAVRIWEIGQSSEEPNYLSLHYVLIQDLLFDSDSRSLVSCANDNFIVVTRFSDYQTPEYKVLSGHEFSVGSLAYDPNAKRLASGDASGLIVLWGDGVPIGILRGHDSSVSSLAFSVDGRLLASAGADGNVLLWSMDDLNAAPVVLVK